MPLTDRLAQDLGLDSLASAELVIWIEKEFGFSVGTPESLSTVGDVVLAASGKGISAIESPLRSAELGLDGVAAATARFTVPAGATITEVFLAQASRRAGQVHPRGPGQRRGHVSAPRARPAADGARRSARLPGRYVGIMLPASVGAGLFYLAALFAGKTPVMINWTTGSRNLVHALDLLGVERVITAKALLAKLETMGIDLSALVGRFVLAEDLRAWFTTGQKMAALVRSYLDWGALRGHDPDRRGGGAVHQRVREPAEGGSADARQHPDATCATCSRRSRFWTATC